MTTGIFFETTHSCINAERSRLEMNGNISVDMTMNSGNNLASEEVETLINQALISNTTPVSTRPTRASKARALNKIRNIHEWENCSENSTLFKQVENAINEEFDALHPEERREMQNEDSEYSESEQDSDENLSFVDSDSDHVDDAASWSAAESEPDSETELSDDESEDDNEVPTLTREPGTILEELDEIASPSIFLNADTPTRGTDDLPLPTVTSTRPPKRKRLVIESSDSE
tara:strand:+ start:2068 stop:2763 length:696 start_codon:yes stop_codon:yes gene_type:complete